MPRRNLIQVNEAPPHMQHILMGKSATHYWLKIKTKNVWSSWCYERTPLDHLQQAGPYEEDEPAGGTGRPGRTVRHAQVPVEAVPVRRREVQHLVGGVGGLYVVAAGREEGGLFALKKFFLIWLHGQ